MGFLNHSTNNIIIDAVLTEKGREYLSRNDNSFNITQFRLGDDEVDYSILEKYGLIIGKEKIEKNTPIFEAITDENIALKYPLRTFISNNTNNIFAFPYLKVDENVTSPVRITSNANSSNNIFGEIIVKTFLNQDLDFTLDDRLVDRSFTIKMFDKILKIKDIEPNDIENDIGIYELDFSYDGTDFTNQKVLRFEVTASGRTTNSSYQYYSSASGDGTTINTQVQIIGNNTNSTVIIPVEITSNEL